MYSPFTQQRREIPPQTNDLIVRTVEFACKQLYVLHRKPFLLQMFGSIAPLLDSDRDGDVYADAFKVGACTWRCAMHNTNTPPSLPLSPLQVQPRFLYKLLCSFNRPCHDLTHVMELVKMKKPLTALDFCYQGEPENISVLECISLCVLVVAYDSGTRRARQMLTVMEVRVKRH